MSSSTICTRKRSIASLDLANSSDTEPSPIKRRCRDRPSTPTHIKRRTTATNASPRKNIQHVILDLEDILRRCATESIDRALISELLDIKQEHGPPLYAIKKIILSVRLAVKDLTDDDDKWLETEMYSAWLHGYQPVFTAIKNILGARVNGSRRRQAVAGLGWICFTILYHLIDEFISEVNAHQDGSTSHRLLGVGLSDYPLTMTLAEEANDPSADARSEEAIAAADALLTRYDTVMLLAAQRYKAESGLSKRVASTVGCKEHALANSCCLLSEQTGFGSDDTTGNVLFKKTRSFMKKWRNEYGDIDQENGVDNADNFD